MKRVSKFSPWQLLFALVVLGSLVSCGGDDGPMDIDYYLNIQSTEAFKNSATDQQQGTTSESGTSIIYTSIMLMHQAIVKAYPVRGTTGNDAAVITACDEIYRSYLESQGEKDGPVVCVVSLCRAHMEGEIVKSSVPLKTYRFRSTNPSDVLGN